MNFLKKTGHYFGRTFDKFPATKNRPCFIAAAAVCVCAYGARCCALRVCCFFDAPLASLRGLAAGQGGAQALTASLFAGGLRRRPAAARRPVRRPCLVCWLRQSCSRPLVPCSAAFAVAASCSSIKARSNSCSSGSCTFSGTAHSGSSARRSEDSSRRRLLQHPRAPQ